MSDLVDADRPEGCRAVVMWGGDATETPGTEDARVDSLNNAVTAVCTNSSFGPTSHVLAEKPWDGMTTYGKLSDDARRSLGAACLNCPKKIL